MNATPVQHLTNIQTATRAALVTAFVVERIEPVFEVRFFG